MFYFNDETSLDDIIESQISFLKEKGYLETGDVVVSTGSTPVHLNLPTNVLKVSKVD